MANSHRKLNPRRWADTRRRVFDRDGWRCKSCGRAGRLECDHVTPLWQDQDQDPFALEGLQALCRGCHVEKTRQEAAAERERTAPAAAAWARAVAELL